MKSMEQQLEEAREEIDALKRMVAGRDDAIETLRAMVKRAAREMRAGSKDILADLEKVKT
jgi:predicted RNase H-like nuclease (RuvC/YqgF family)